jgi:hypothetical protein
MNLILVEKLREKKSFIFFTQGMKKGKKKNELFESHASYKGKEKKGKIFHLI